jgi:hypothetical protein
MQVVMHSRQQVGLRKKHCGILHDYNVMTVLVTGVTIHMNRKKSKEKRSYFSLSNPFYFSIHENIF